MLASWSNCVNLFEFVTLIKIQNIIFDFFKQNIINIITSLHYIIECITKYNVILKLNSELN
jgi:hypothetical protein